MLDYRCFRNSTDAIRNRAFEIFEPIWLIKAVPGSTKHSWCFHSNFNNSIVVTLKRIHRYTRGSILKTLKQGTSSNIWKNDSDFPCWTMSACIRSNWSGIFHRLRSSSIQSTWPDYRAILEIFTFSCNHSIVKILRFFSIIYRFADYLLFSIICECNK